MSKDIHAIKTIPVPSIAPQQLNTMKTKLWAFLSVLLAMVVAVPAMAVTVTNDPSTQFNVTHVPTFGDGTNPTGGWVGTVNNAGVGAFVRAKHRTDGTTPNDGAGVYNFPTGTAPSSTRAVWNFEFSAMVPVGMALAAYDWALTVQWGANIVTFNPFAAFLDNEFGTPSTPNGAGTINPLLYLSPTVNIGGNSENITFGYWGGDPNANETYYVSLAATDLLTGDEAVRSNMAVVVGTAVPDGGATALMMAPVLGIIGLMRRNKNAPVTS